MFGLFKRKHLEPVARKFRLPFRRRVARAFSAALPSIFRFEWGTHDRDINSEIFWYLEPLRARSRDLAKNDPYFKRYLQLVRQNMIGPRGVRFQSRARDLPTAGNPDGALDNFANRLIEREFREWSKLGNFDVTGQISRLSAEQLAVCGMARDGEFLWRIVRGLEGNRFAYAIQILEPERLDIKKNEARDPETGNRIVMGVEVDSFGKPIAYHLLGAPPASTQFHTIETLRSGEHIRVPARDIVHGFLREWPEQMRGLPWGHASMTSLRDLNGYREAALVNARVGANKIGVWKTPTGEGDDADLEIENGTVFQDAEPGEQRVVPETWEFEKWDPTYPLGEFPDFNKFLLRGVAAGLGVFSPLLMQDVENVNLSSIRGGLQDDREGWMALQNVFIQQAYGKVFPDWLAWMLTSGRLGNLPMRNFDKFNAPHWQPRRWKSPDPLKDSQARALDWGLRTRSISEMIEEDGRDPDEVFAELERDKERLEAAGLSPTISTGLQFDQEGPPEAA